MAGMFNQASPVTGNVALIMPALNEEAVVGEQVRAILAHPGLQALPVSQVIVVDNGSMDSTAAVAQMAGATVVRQPRRGYGFACLAGVLAARNAEIIVLMDADGSDDLAGVEHVVRSVMNGTADLAMGSRVRGHLEHGALTLQQRIGNTLATLLLRWLFGTHVTDLGPMRAIRRSSLLALEMQEMTYGWSTEMLVKAAKTGYRVVEVPVDYHRRAGGRSKVSGTISGTLRASWCILSTILRYARWQPATLTGERPAFATIPE